MPARTSETSPISLPLYGAAFAATLCGILTVAATVDYAPFTQETLALTCAGFVFSLGCRALRISPRFVEGIGLGAIAVGIGATVSNRVNWGALVPPMVTQGDLRLAVFLCWAAALLSWALLHDSITLFTPVLAVAIIGLVSSFDLNNYVAAYFVALLIASIFLLTHLHGLRLRALLGQQGQRAPSEGHLVTQLALAAACGLVVVLLGLLLVAPVEALTHNLSLAGAIRRLASIAPSQQPTANAFRFSDDVNFDIGTGSGWSASSVVLAKVVPSDGEPHLWRGRTYDHYNGFGWQSALRDQWHAMSPEMTEPDGGQIYPVPTPFYPGRRVLIATFDLLGDTDELLYASTIRRVSLPVLQDGAPRYCEDGRLDTDTERMLAQQHYSETSLLAPDPMDPGVQIELRQAGSRYSPFITEHYIGNMSEEPDGDLNPGALAYFRRVVVRCIATLPPGRRTPIDIVLALRAWVSGHCVYSLSVQPIPTDEDHVYDFLAKTRRGYCDMYASSLAVLCRIAGVPARVATGFAPGAPDGTAYDLRAMDRHAWTEVYFPGSGWLDFDATLGTPTDGSVPDPKSAAPWTWRALTQRFGLGTAILAALIAAALGYAFYTEWQARWQTRRARHGQPRLRLADEPGRRYRLMTKALGPLGIMRRPAETPDEFAARAAAFLRSQAPLPPQGPDAALIGLLTADLNQKRYSQSPAADAPDRDAAVRAFVKAAARLRLRMLLAPLPWKNKWKSTT